MVAACLWASPAWSQTDEEELFDEIVVYGDLFARWDDTRWLVETELSLPLVMTFAKDQDLEIRATAMQVRAVLACNKDEQLRKKRWVVDCVVEDVALQVVPYRNDRGKKKLADGQLVLDEVDAKLTGSALQLQVADDGRVMNIDLEGVPKTNRRISLMHETLRQVMSRVVVGFDLKLRKFNQLHEGKWTEYNSALMSMPVPPQFSGVAGSSMLVHYLNKYQGQVLVQSIGKGGVNVPINQSLAGGQGDRQLNFITELIGVSIFDPEEGYMTERVWSLTGSSSGSNLFNAGTYSHAGRIRMLGTKEQPNLGATGLVNAPGEDDRGLGEWVPIEQP
jgi:hypothetical protein